MKNFCWFIGFLLFLSIITGSNVYSADIHLKHLVNANQYKGESDPTAADFDAIKGNTGGNIQNQIDTKANLQGGNTWTGDQDFGSGDIITTGNISGATYGSDGSVSDAELTGMLNTCGGISVVTKTSTATLTANTIAKVMITNIGATVPNTLTLPPANPVQFISYINEAGVPVYLDPNGTDQIITLTDAAGDRILSDAVVGTSISLMCITQGKWYVMGYNGAWTDAN
jgi:hypothetical protein